MSIGIEITVTGLAQEGLAHVFKLFSFLWRKCTHVRVGDHQAFFTFRITASADAALAVAETGANAKPNFSRQTYATEKPNRINGPPVFQKSSRPCEKSA